MIHLQYSNGLLYTYTVARFNYNIILDGDSTTGSNESPPFDGRHHSVPSEGRRHRRAHSQKYQAECLQQGHGKISSTRCSYKTVDALFLKDFSTRGKSASCLESCIGPEGEYRARALVETPLIRISLTYGETNADPPPIRRTSACSSH